MKWVNTNLSPPQKICHRTSAECQAWYQMRLRRAAMSLSTVWPAYPGGFIGYPYHIPTFTVWGSSPVVHSSLPFWLLRAFSEQDTWIVSAQERLLCPCLPHLQLQSHPTTGDHDQTNQIRYQIKQILVQDPLALSLSCDFISCPSHSCIRLSVTWR